MDLGLRGKKAIVTGGTRGIGRAIAETLAAEGCDVALCARHSQEVDEAVASLKSRGVRAIGEVVDIGQGEALKDWVKKAGEALEGIDILISNASALVSGNSEEAWRNAVEIDLLGAVRSTEAARPFLQKAGTERGDAAIVIISSVSAAEASYPSAYGAIKASLLHLTKGLAAEGARQHVRANAISPGTIYFRGGVWHRVETNNPQRFQSTLSKNPLGRMGTPQEVANAAAFLASPAASFITGVNLMVDGGITSRVNF